MKLIIAVIIVIVPILGATNFATGQTRSETASGSLCVLPNSSEPPTRFSPGGQYNPATLTLKIDKLDSIHWPHKKPVLINDLDLQERHLVVLTSDGKRIQSLRFKFSKEDNARLCISFDGYGGVQLGNQVDAAWCKVEKRACSP